MQFDIDYSMMPEFVIVRTNGPAEVDGFDRLLSEIITSPDWIPGTDQIIDHRKLDLEKTTHSEMNRIRLVVENYKGRLGNGRTAFVMSDALGFGFARMYELSGGDNIHTDIGIFFCH